MNASDIIAPIAVVISLFTLYWTVLRSANIVSPAPRVIAFLNKGEGQCFVGTTVFLTNTGAKPADIDYLFLELSTPDKSTYTFHCILETSIRQFHYQPLERTQDNTPKPFTIAPGSAITKDLIFGSDELKNLPTGRITLTLYIVLVGRSKPLRMNTTKVQLNVSIPIGDFREAVWARQAGILVIQDIDSE